MKPLIKPELLHYGCHTTFNFFFYKYATDTVCLFVLFFFERANEPTKLDEVVRSSVVSVVQFHCLRARIIIIIIFQTRPVCCSFFLKF